MARFGRWLLALAAVSVVGGAPAMASAASPESPVVSMGPLDEWVWWPAQFSGGPGEVVFYYGPNNNPVALLFPSGVNYAAIDQKWGGFDNLAPLVWYYAHDQSDPAGVGPYFFGSGVQYSSQVITKMNAEHFAPAMVGGVDPTGITTSATTTPPASSSTQPPAQTTGTSTGGKGTSGAGGIQPAAVSPTTPPEPPVLQHPTPPANYQHLLALEQQTLAKKVAADPRKTFRWMWLLAAAALLAVVAGLWRGHGRYTSA